MLQLSLNFLQRQIDRLKPERPTVRGKREIVEKHGIPVHLVRRPRARRYLLSLLPDGTARRDPKAGNGD